MKDFYTHVAILIDKSGSMRDIKSDVIGGFNQLITDQKNEPGELTVSLAQFDYFDGKLQYEVSNNFSPLNEVMLLNESNYVPRGSTPLNDALARLITETGQKLSSLDENNRPSKVLIVCITDGLENKSIEYTKESLKSIIIQQEEKYNWKFMYVGANQDAFAEGGSRGIKANYTFLSNSAGTKKMNKVVGQALSSYRSSGESFNLSAALDEISKKADLDEQQGK